MCWLRPRAYPKSTAVHMRLNPAAERQVRDVTSLKTQADITSRTQTFKPSEPLKRLMEDKVNESHRRVFLNCEARLESA